MAIEVVFVEFEGPRWGGRDQVDPAVYEMNPAERAMIEPLAAYLERLRAIDPTRHGTRTERAPSGSFIIEPVDNDPIIDEFFSLAAEQMPVIDYGAYPVPEWLQQPDFLDRAQLPQLQVVIVWMTRGEKFCTGFWGGELKNGNLIRLVARLAALLESTQPENFASISAVYS